MTHQIVKLKTNRFETSPANNKFGIFSMLSIELRGQGVGNKRTTMLTFIRLNFATQRHVLVSI